MSSRGRIHLSTRLGASGGHGLAIGWCATGRQHAPETASRRRRSASDILSSLSGEKASGRLRLGCDPPSVCASDDGVPPVLFGQQEDERQTSSQRPSKNDAQKKTSCTKPPHRFLRYTQSFNYFSWTTLGYIEIPNMSVTSRQIICSNE